MGKAASFDGLTCSGNAAATFNPLCFKGAGEIPPALLSPSSISSSSTSSSVFSYEFAMSSSSGLVLYLRSAAAILCCSFLTELVSDLNCACTGVKCFFFAVSFFIDFAWMRTMAIAKQKSMYNPLILF